MRGNMDFSRLHTMAGTTKEELEQIQAGILALAKGDEKIDYSIPSYTWEQKIDQLVSMAKLIGTYLEVEREEPGSDGHKETRGALKDAFEQFCDWRHDEPYVADEIKKLIDTEAIRLEDRVEAIMDEFGDNPDTCLACLSEEIGLRRHYRQFPNAPRHDAYE
jgi:hypothetical protein